MIGALVLISAIALLGSAAHGGSQTPPADAYAAGRTVVGDLEWIVTPNGIQQLVQVPLGAMDQWISIRGANRDDPVLLFVHGGPGAQEMSVGWTFQRPWEDYFTVVHWDQRGAGKTLRSAGAVSRQTALRRQL